MDQEAPITLEQLGDAAARRTHQPPDMVRQLATAGAIDTWQRVSPLRWQAPHPTVAGALLLVVVDREEPTHAVGQYTAASDPAKIRAAYASLRVTLMQGIAQRDACHDGTPLLHENNYGMRVCVYCGSPDSDTHAAGWEKP